MAISMRTATPFSNLCMNGRFRSSHPKESTWIVMPAPSAMDRGLIDLMRMTKTDMNTTISFCIS